MFLPKSRSTGVVVQSLNNEVLIYDLGMDKAYHLNETSSIVFNCCNGETTGDELKEKYNFTDEVIYLALDQLKNENLLEDSYVSPFAGLSRREIVKKIGLASVIALPIISSIIAPTATNAASGRLAPNSLCTTPSQCQSNNCNATIIGTNPPTVFQITQPITTPGTPPMTIPGNPPITIPGSPGTVIPGQSITFPGTPIFSPPICQ